MLTQEEIDTILFYIESGIQGEDLNKQEETVVDSLFNKLSNATILNA
tara:strand:+ start:1044 stop:1184 length:141 start_codon:yes stop_codon:yes gene_type:complete